MEKQINIEHSNEEMHSGVDVWTDEDMRIDRFEPEFWHEYRSPVTIAEIRDFYRGCCIQNGEIYIEVSPATSFVRMTGNPQYEATKVTLQVPVMLPQRKNGHYLPFECALQETENPLFGITVPQIFIMGANTNVFPCDISFFGNVRITAEYELDSNPEYIMIYTADSSIAEGSFGRSFVTLKMEISDKEVYCFLVPASVIQLITPFSAYEVFNCLLHSRFLSEEREYLAH